jgi:hypothetical protein
MSHALPRGLEERLSQLYPGTSLVRAVPLGADTGGDETDKELGYGRPIRVTLARADGEPFDLVFHLAASNGYGHDRRADRAGSQLLAWDSFSLLPSHARALDIGAVADDGSLLPLSRAGEFYLLTEWAPGLVYAEDLRRISAHGACAPIDLQRLDALTDWLLEVHQRPGTSPHAYTRAWRDLVGSGEGIAGIVDGFGTGVPGAPASRLASIEASCLTWRQHHKHRVERLRRTHGDAHPFNILFEAGSSSPTWLDTSRGSEGEAADDVTCLAINFLFFGLEHRARWSAGLGQLWHRFWQRYLALGDRGVLDVAAPFLAWRALVLCNPAWYPKLGAADRDRLLRFVEKALAAESFDPFSCADVMR